MGGTVKNLKIILLIAILVITTTSCSKNYDEHYKEMDSLISSSILDIQKTYIDNLYDVSEYIDSSDFVIDFLEKLQNESYIKEYDSNKFNLVKLDSDIEGLENTLLNDKNAEYSQEYIEYANATINLLKKYKKINDSMLEYILTLDSEKFEESANSTYALSDAFITFYDARLNFLYTVEYDAETAKQIMSDYVSEFSKTLN